MTPTLSASLRSLVRSTILGLARKGSLSISFSSDALPLAPPLPPAQQYKMWTKVLAKHLPKYYRISKSTAHIQV